MKLIMRQMKLNMHQMKLNMHQMKLNTFAPNDNIIIKKTIVRGPSLFL